MDSYLCPSVAQTSGLIPGQTSCLVNSQATAPTMPTLTELDANEYAMLTSSTLLHNTRAEAEAYQATGAKLSKTDFFALISFQLSKLMTVAHG